MAGLVEPGAALAVKSLFAEQPDRGGGGEVCHRDDDADRFRDSHGQNKNQEGDAQQHRDGEFKHHELAGLISAG